MKVYAVISRCKEYNHLETESMHRTVKGAEAEQLKLEIEAGLELSLVGEEDHATMEYWIRTFDLEE